MTRLSLLLIGGLILPVMSKGQTIEVNQPLPCPPGYEKTGSNCDKREKHMAKCFTVLGLALAAAGTTAEDTRRGCKNKPEGDRATCYAKAAAVFAAASSSAYIAFDVCKSAKPPCVNECDPITISTVVPPPQGDQGLPHCPSPEKIDCELDGGYWTSTGLTTGYCTYY